jgi:TRAP-type C4-dicarboxylate transport system permease small subunit
MDHPPARGGKVSGLKMVAVLLIAAGALGLVYGGITYTKTTHDAKVGPFEVSVKDKETVNVPVWAGVAAIVVGGALLLVPRKK